MSDESQSRLSPPPAEPQEPADPPAASIGAGVHVLSHESQVIGKPPESRLQPEYPPLFVPDRSDDDQDTQEDLAPAKGILVSLVIGGLLWLVIIYVLSRL